MIIVRTPTRISLFGSSTDYPSWIAKHGGISVNFAINQYSWLSLKNLPPFFDYKSKISYSEIECINSHEDIKHNVIREALKYMHIEEGIDLVHQSDLFSKCGLGSSSTFSVALMHILSAYRGVFWSKSKLAQETMKLEQDILKEHVGLQDTLAATYGGLNVFNYYSNGDITTTPIFLSKENLKYFQESCLLFFSGISRRANDLTSRYVPTLIEKEKEQKQMMAYALEGLDYLQRGDLPKMGNLLNLTWEAKRNVSDLISTPELDKYYHISKNLAWGFKVLGAGGGGSILIMADKSKHYEIRQAIDLVEIPFNIDWNGSKILYVNQGL